MNKIVYTNTIIIWLLLTLGSCEKIGDFGDTNVNPATTSLPETSALLTNVLAGLGKYSVPNIDPGFISYHAAFYCQYLNETYLAGNSIYRDMKSSPMDYYSGDLNDLENIILLNSEETTRERATKNGPNEDQIALARILKAYLYWIITDCWGDIPYSDALNKETNVRYDSQEVIYTNLLIELSEAVGQFSAAYPVKGDIVYNSEIIKWKKLANSIRMIMALRLSKQYPSAESYAAVQFRSALLHEAGSIENNDDNFQLNYPGGNFRNPYFNIYFNSEGVTGESATMTTLLGSLNNDQRQTVFGADFTGAPSDLGVPVGIRNPGEWCTENPTYCYIFHPDNREEGDPLYIITASQVLLARAEAADRGWTPETDNTTALYREGITQSFLQWGLEAPDNTYFNSENVALTAVPGTGVNLKQIATQQYISFYPDGVQGWSTWRRTGYPELFPAPDAINIPPVIPRRYKYGTEDYDLTPEGVQEAVARLPGGDRMDSRIWWDKE